MSITRQHIQLTARMYEMQETARRIFATRYEEITGSWQRAIRAVMEREKLDPIQAVLFISRDTTHGVDMSDGVHVLAMTAALVDLIESSGGPGGERP